ncbi:hypothetical protein BST29_12955 [Mycobacterium malmoense]|uniref:Helix-turn-helix domain-containing protein n=1 Tax=Mycobacterium malmoense TaxID=1780 RepID=A0ABX3SRH9_MYCMA|nr:hypothetical protein BMG05_01095 [Mycobacterium malmoense]ORA82095.1 hypothetical protein BST29_12955 [Mycobacterium malmoense]
MSGTEERWARHVEVGRLFLAGHTIDAVAQLVGLSTWRVTAILRQSGELREEQAPRTNLSSCRAAVVCMRQGEAEETVVVFPILAEAEEAARRGDRLGCGSRWCRKTHTVVWLDEGRWRSRTPSLPAAIASATLAAGRTEPGTR